jgi:SAM-dependent methyltransferase
MTAAIPVRRRCQGVRQILRFNRRFYLRTLAGVTAMLLMSPHLPAFARDLMLAAALPALFWLGSSLLVSWYVYDRSPLYRLAWLAALLSAPPRKWVNIHAGLDETSHLLAGLFPLAEGRVLDIHDPVEMTEPSIEEARRYATLAPSADWRALPLSDGSCDAAFLIFAAHELRHHEARVTLFREVARSLRPGGELIVVEHLRDAANFFAFGPGFLHFLPRSAWRRAASAAGLEVRSESSITPFVNVFHLRRPI